MFGQDGAAEQPDAWSPAYPVDCEYVRPSLPTAHSSVPTLSVEPWKSALMMSRYISYGQAAFVVFRGTYAHTEMW